MMPKKLILHVDLNNTILASDDATGQGTLSTLDEFISTVTWGKTNKRGKWEWLSESPSLLPPCEGAVSYHAHYGQVNGFTLNAGKCFHGVLEEHLKLLRWPEGVKGDKDLSIEGEDGQLYHWIFPSFFQLLKDLAQEGREFAVVFRTFGVDLPQVLRAMSRALVDGAHPLFPDLPDLKLSVNMDHGKIRRSKKGIFVRRGEDRLSSDADGERGLYQYFSSSEGLGGFQDDYSWWVTYRTSGGKPLWIDPFDQDVQHIFIDDNIRLNDPNCVMDSKIFLEKAGAETRVASVSELYDVALIQNDLLQAISDPNYFTKRIRICVENYAGNIQQD